MPPVDVHVRCATPRLCRTASRDFRRSVPLLECAPMRVRNPVAHERFTPALADSSSNRATCTAVSRSAPRSPTAITPSCARCIASACFAAPRGLRHWPLSFSSETRDSCAAARTGSAATTRHIVTLARVSRHHARLLSPSSPSCSRNRQQNGTYTALARHARGIAPVRDPSGTLRSVVQLNSLAPNPRTAT